MQCYIVYKMNVIKLNYRHLKRATNLCYINNGIYISINLLYVSIFQFSEK